jgi:hypothetical protein
MTYKFSKGHAMNDQNASATQVQHGMPRVAARNSRLSRITRGLLASFGFAAFLLASAPALAQVLGTASDFAVLGATPNVTNTGPTIVSGNVGVYPAASITGFPPGSIVPGTGFLHLADAVAQQAQADNLTAFGTLTAGVGAALGPALDDVTRCGSVGCVPLVPGTYDVGAANLTGTLTLSGGGTYIFRATSLTTAAGPGASVVVMNSGSPCDVWWTSAASVSIGTGSVMLGNILAHTSITMGTGASLQGRALAYTGTVTLDDNAVTACSGGTAPYAVAAPVAILPPATPTPTLSEWAMIMLVALLAMTGFVAMRRQG